MIENFLIIAGMLLLALIIPTMWYRKSWDTSTTNFLFANRSLKMMSSAMAINSHWFWAIAIFVSPAVAYNWGLIGLLWFVIPNALSLIVVALLSRKIRHVYPDGFSLTEFIKTKCSARIVSFYYLMFTCIALAGMLLGFTALFKFFTFLGTGYAISPIYIVLIFGLITLIFSATGGIRTSVFTGTIQTVGWIAFLSYTTFLTVGNAGVDFLLTHGKNNLETIFDIKFLTTFAVAFLITIIVGATSHGMMWQKSFSMPKENILPSYTIAAVIFAAMVFMMGSLGLYAFSTGITIAAADLSQLATVSALSPILLFVFGLLLVGQTSTVTDSCLNYISSVITREFFKTDSVLTARLTMVAFFIVAWAMTWLKMEVWTIFMLMGVLRVSMFMPLVSMINNFKFNEQAVFYSSIIAVTGSLYLSWTARLEKLPIFDMYSAMLALGIGTIVSVYSITRNKN